MCEHVHDSFTWKHTRLGRELQKYQAVCRSDWPCFYYSFIIIILIIILVIIYYFKILFLYPLP